MDKRFELIKHEVERQFRSERAFYREALGINQNAWEKYKSGETDFSNIKLSTYKRMMGLLFTSYEAMLIDQAIESVNFKWSDNVVDAFHSTKLEHASAMLDRGAKIECVGANMETGQPLKNAVTKIAIVEETGGRFSNKITFQVSVPPHDIPSGKKNRREWFNNDFTNVDVK